MKIQDFLLSDKKYKTILADPPWKYDFSATNTRKIENQYPTMEIEDIYKLPINDISDDNSILFLWTTAPKLIEGLEVMKSWGFQYKTHLIWDKINIGMGYWFRGQHELLLLGTKGNPKIPIPENRISSILKIKRTEHSEKPKNIYFIIEKMSEEPRIELFARDHINNWDYWGNESMDTTQEVFR